MALGAVVRGETYHFEIVANESARGILDVQLETGVPVANGVLTTDTEEQARARAAVKGAEAARVAVEMANTLKAVGGMTLAAPARRASSRCRASTNGCTRAPARREVLKNLSELDGYERGRRTRSSRPS